MTVNEELIKQLAETAAIHMEPEELQAAVHDLEAHIAFTDSLLGIDTTGASEQTHTFAETGLNRLREDKVTNKDHAKELTAAAPDSKDSYFRVPRTIEE